jgi:hypothetical protein
MNSSIYRVGLGWGSALWFAGYLLGFLFYFFVPPALIGWLVTPIGVALTLWVLFRKTMPMPFSRYLLVGFIWALIAVVFDYFFLVKLLNPADGYYKADVYLYYVLTFLLPVAVGWIKNRNRPMA